MRRRICGKFAPGREKDSRRTLDRFPKDPSLEARHAMFTLLRTMFQRANDAGGVNGRTVDYAGFKDDSGDPSAGTSAATKLVQQDQVFAVVPAVTPDFAARSSISPKKPSTHVALGASPPCVSASHSSLTSSLRSSSVEENSWW